MQILWDIGGVRTILNNKSSRNMYNRRPIFSKFNTAQYFEQV